MPEQPTEREKIARIVERLADVPEKRLRVYGLAAELIDGDELDRETASMMQPEINLARVELQQYISGVGGVRKAVLGIVGERDEASLR